MFMNKVIKGVSVLVISLSLATPAVINNNINVNAKHVRTAKVIRHARHAKKNNRRAKKQKEQAEDNKQYASYVHKLNRKFNLKHRAKNYRKGFYDGLNNKENKYMKNNRNYRKGYDTIIAFEDNSGHVNNYTMKLANRYYNHLMK